VLGTPEELEDETTDSDEDDPNVDAELDISENEVRASDRGDEDDNELDVDDVLFVVELVVEAVSVSIVTPNG
jgi:hypothetical protein